MLRKAVFLDRDGVINKDFGYVYKISDIVWVDGVIETIKLFNKKNYLVFVITNQSGIGRNFYTESDVIKLHIWMKNYLEKENAIIDEFCFCPHHPDACLDKYKIDCKFRKPNAGMITSFIQRFKLDKNLSFLIGDKDSDIKAAENAGIKGYKFNSENLFNFTISNIDLR